MIRQLLSQLAVLSAVCTVTLIICPGAELKKYVRFACVLCALSVIISFLPFSGKPPDTEAEAVSVTDMTEEAAKLIAEQTVSHLEQAVVDLAKEKHGIDKEDINVKITYSSEDGQTMRLKTVTAELKGLKYAVYTVSLKNEVKELLSLPCEVVISE